MRPLPTLLLALAALVPAASRAVPLTVIFTGTISSIDPPLGSPFANGQSGSGSFQIESTTFDEGPSAGVGIYRGATSFSFTFGAYTATSAGGTFDDFVRVDDVTPPALGADLLTAQAVDVSGAMLLDWYVPTRLELVLNGGDGNAFSGDDLPTSLDLDDFSFGFAQIEFGSASPGDFAAVTLTLTSITVPEPAALLLLMLMLAGLGLRASHRA